MQMRRWPWRTGSLNCSRVWRLAQLGAVGFPNLMKGDRLDEDAALAVVPQGIGQVTRIGATAGLMPAQTAELLKEIQGVMVERTRSGPPSWCARGRSGVIARLGRRGAPIGTGRANSWGPGLVEESAGALREAGLATVMSSYCRVAPGLSGAGWEVGRVQFAVVVEIGEHGHNATVETFVIGGP